MNTQELLQSLPSIGIAEMRQDFASILCSVQTQPLAVHYHRRCVAVMLSVKEYKNLMRLKEVLASGLSPEQVA